uniref:IgiC, putative n=1 Tax=Caulobacter sp. (strain K31) TaxID=366602 RepID=B0T6L8_CAUSK
MANILGWRKVFGIPTPSVNTVVQLEYEALRPVGCVNHCEGIRVPDGRPTTPEEGERLLAVIDAALEDAVERIMTCRPDHIILGISAESIWGGGLGAASQIESRIKAISGDLPVTQAAQALPAALKALGIKGAIGVVHPYADLGDPQLRRFFADIGQEVARTQSVPVTSLAEIAHTPVRAMIDTIKAVDGDDVEAIVQFGANLPFGRVADAAETWLGKPVIAVNVATYWHALRREGIEHRVEGYGALFSHF